MLPKLCHVMAHVQKDNICPAPWDKLGEIWNIRGGSVPPDVTGLWSCSCHYASLRRINNHLTQFRKLNTGHSHKLFKTQSISTLIITVSFWIFHG